MEKTARLGWLSGEKIRLHGLVNQFAQYIYVRRGFSNDEERAYARKLLEMTEMVDAEGSRVAQDLTNDSLKEIAQWLMK